MNQVALFHETLLDAIGADIAAAGGFKIVAGKLWPTDTNAAAKLRNALNPDQPHKLAPDEVLAIKKLAREAGSTATIDFEAENMGFSVTWINPVDEAEELRRQVKDLLTDVTRKLDRIERAEARK